MNYLKNVALWALITAGIILSGIGVIKGLIWIADNVNQWVSTGISIVFVATLLTWSFPIFKTKK